MTADSEVPCDGALCFAATYPHRACGADSGWVPRFKAIREDARVIAATNERSIAQEAMRKAGGFHAKEYWKLFAAVEQTGDTSRAVRAEVTAKVVAAMPLREKVST